MTEILYSFDDVRQIREERDAARLQVQSLQGQLDTQPDRTLIDVLRVENEELRSQVTCAKLAADLASKEREALRQLVREFFVLASQDIDVIVECGFEMTDDTFRPEWAAKRDNLLARSETIALGTEEPK